MALSIPPSVLAPLVIGGVSFVVALTWWMGWAESTEIPSVLAAKARYAHDFPDDVIRDVLLADDGQAALLWLDRGCLGAVTVLGDKLVVRRMALDQVRSVDVTDAGLRVRVRDFGGPDLAVASSDPEVRATWRDRLAPAGEVARA